MPTRSHQISMMTPKRPTSQKRRLRRHSAAGIRPHLRSLTPEKPFLTSAQAVESTCCSSARRVGPTGKAYGLDMTDEMLALARENQKKGGRRER